MGRSLTFFVPSNRVTSNGRKKGLDGFNEIISANRVNRYVGAKQERENVRNAMSFALAAMHEKGFAPIRGKAKVLIKIIEPNARRDEGNVIAASKHLLDGITMPRGKKKGAGLIVDDSPKWCELSVSVQVIEGQAGAYITVVEDDG